MGNWDDINELSSVYINKVIYPDSNLNEDESASEDESPEEFEMPKSIYITSVNSKFEYCRSIAHLDPAKCFYLGRKQARIRKLVY